MGKICASLTIVAPIVTFLAAFTIVLFGSSALTPTMDEAGASSVSVGLTVAPAIELEAPTAYDLTPGVGDDVPVIMTRPVIVSTNNPLGYKLYASVDLSLSCLRHTGTTAVGDCKDIDSSLKVPLSTASTVSLPWNSWGLSINDGSNWLGFEEGEPDYGEAVVGMYCDAYAVAMGLSVEDCMVAIRYDAGDDPLLALASDMGGPPEGMVDRASIFAWIVSTFNQMTEDSCVGVPGGDAICDNFVPRTPESLLEEFGGSIDTQALLKARDTNYSRDVTQLSVGARVDMSIKAGTYNGEIIITAVPEPLPMPVIGRNYNIDYEISPELGQHCSYTGTNPPEEGYANDCLRYVGIGLMNLDTIYGWSLDENGDEVSVPACSLLDGSLSVIDNSTVVCDYSGRDVRVSFSCDDVGWKSIWGTHGTSRLFCG